jgi:hypothetical protein
VLLVEVEVVVESTRQLWCDVYVVFEVLSKLILLLILTKTGYDQSWISPNISKNVKTEDRTAVAVCCSPGNLRSYQSESSPVPVFFQS